MRGQGLGRVDLAEGTAWAKAWRRARGWPDWGAERRQLRGPQGEERRSGSVGASPGRGMGSVEGNKRPRVLISLGVQT